MVPEGLLPHSQVPPICPYHELAQSRQCPKIQITVDPSNYYAQSTPPSTLWSHSPRYPHQKSCTRLSPPAFALYVRPSYFSRFNNRTILGELYKSVSSSLCSFFPFTCYRVPLRPKYSPLHTILNHVPPSTLSCFPLQNCCVITKSNSKSTWKNSQNIRRLKCEDIELVVLTAESAERSDIQRWLLQFVDRKHLHPALCSTVYGA
jgi:hypothetical protein